jgi:hypothetical protein
MKNLKRITALMLVLVLGVLAPMGAAQATTGINSHAQRILDALAEANVPGEFIGLTRQTFIIGDIQPTEVEANRIINVYIAQARALVPSGYTNWRDLPISVLTNIARLVDSAGAVFGIEIGFNPHDPDFVLWPIFPCPDCPDCPGCPCDCEDSPEDCPPTTAPPGSSNNNGGESPPEATPPGSSNNNGGEGPPVAPDPDCPSNNNQQPPSNNQQQPPSNNQQQPPSNNQQQPPSNNQQQPPSNNQQQPPSNNQQTPPSAPGNQPPGSGAKPPIRETGLNASTGILAMLALTGLAGGAGLIAKKKD